MKEIEAIVTDLYFESTTMFIKNFFEMELKKAKDEKSLTKLKKRYDTVINELFKIAFRKNLNTKEMAEEIDTLVEDFLLS